MKKLTTKVLSTILSIIFVLSSIMCIGSVTTSAASAPVYTIKSVTNLTHNNAKISARITNPAKTTITKVGFLMGTAKKNLTINKYDSVKMKTNYVDASYLMSKYKVTLKANTTYYYRFYMTTGGKTTYSAIKNFKTKSVESTTPTSIRFPLDTNKVWYASTYVGHGNSVAGSYSSVDITLNNGVSAKGYAVYAVESGEVISYIEDNGQIVIKHTKQLVTNNGKVYKTWYSIYAHMTNISVKVGSIVNRGQQIGKVGAVGKVTGPHLHFGLTSGNNGSTWYQTTDRSKAISPYYVNGFVNTNGSDKSYCVCDRQGTGVTNQLINWVPTGK